MADRVLVVNDLSFEEEVLRSKDTFLLEFGAAWCPPCRKLEPIVESIAAENPSGIRVGKIDTDDAPAVSAKLGVRAVPTVIVFKNGKEHRRHVGLTTKAKLYELMGD
jgi:thioredoxin 1